MPTIEHIPDTGFRLMSMVMAVEDFIFPRIDQRVAGFGIRENMTVVDYGCGPGRYTTRFSRLVGENGRVYALDVHRLAIESVNDKNEKQGLRNIIPVLAEGYQSSIPAQAADVVCALDIFFGIGDPTAFLREILRITKPNGFLIIDDGHQSRQKTIQKIKASGCWMIAEETRDYLKCLPVNKNHG